MNKLSGKKLKSLGAAVVLLVFLYYTGLFGPVEGAMVRVLDPAVVFFHGLGAGIKSAYSRQTSQHDLSAEVSRLRQRVVELTEENAGYRVLDEENELLRHHLDFFEQKEYRYVMARVVSHGDITDITNRTESIIINKGRRDGLSSGLPVLSGQGIIIGKIFEVKDSLAHIYLTNHEQCRLAATILGEDKTSGITEGELGLTIKMKFIPQTEKVASGDLVVTSGLEENIPRGLIIGRVSDIQKESNELWQQAAVEPLVSQEEMIIVSVLLPRK